MTVFVKFTVKFHKILSIYICGCWAIQSVSLVKKTTYVRNLLQFDLTMDTLGWGKFGRKHTLGYGPISDHQSNIQYKITKSQHLNNYFLVLRLSLRNPLNPGVKGAEWRCSWSSADKRWSNYNWVTSNCIAYIATYILEFWLFGAKPFQCWHVNWILGNKFQWNFKQDTYSLKENEFWIVVNSIQFNSIQNSLLLHTVQIWILHSLIIQTTATKNKTWIEQPLVCSPYNNDINVDIWYRGTIELFNQSVQFSILTHIKKWDMYYMKQREREAQYELMCPKSV